MFWYHPIYAPPEDPVIFAADELDPNLITPGAVGFIATLFVAAMTVLLVFDMVRRIRRSRYREEVGIMLDAEIAAEEAALEKNEADLREANDAGK
jgi:hypothetical protein